MADHMSSASYIQTQVTLTVSADTSVKVDTEHSRGREGSRENVVQSVLIELDVL